MNSDLVLASVHCHSCGAECHSEHRFCSQCGTSLAAESWPICKRTTDVPVVQGSTNPLDNRLVVIGILLCAGPLGLPALWFSRRFSRVTKVVTTIAYFVLTAVLPLVIAWYCLDFAVRPLLEALAGNR